MKKVLRVRVAAEGNFPLDDLDSLEVWLDGIRSLGTLEEVNAELVVDVNSGGLDRCRGIDG